MRVLNWFYFPENFLPFCVHIDFNSFLFIFAFLFLLLNSFYIKSFNNCLFLSCMFLFFYLLVLPSKLSLFRTILFFISFLNNFFYVNLYCLNILLTHHSVYSYSYSNSVVSPLTLLFQMRNFCQIVGSHYYCILFLASPSLSHSYLLDTLMTFWWYFLLPKSCLQKNLLPLICVHAYEQTSRHIFHAVQHIVSNPPAACDASGLWRSAQLYGQLVWPNVNRLANLISEEGAAYVAPLPSLFPSHLIADLAKLLNTRAWRMHLSKG